jgi:hypothetical protein
MYPICVCVSILSLSLSLTHTRSMQVHCMNSCMRMCTCMHALVCLRAKIKGAYYIHIYMRIYMPNYYPKQARFRQSNACLLFLYTNGGKYGLHNPRYTCTPAYIHAKCLPDESSISSGQRVLGFSVYEWREIWLGRPRTADSSLLQILSNSSLLLHSRYA